MLRAPLAALALVAAPLSARAEPGPWLEPVRRVTLIASLFDDDAARPFSTAAHPRDIAGAVDVACEHRAGDPCGDGAIGVAAVEAAAGYGEMAQIAVRARAERTPAGLDAAIDRLHAEAVLGPVFAELGRDAVTVGPAARTMLGWGDTAAPLDHARIATAHPIALGPVRAEALYLVGRLRAPQTYPGALVTIARGELAFGPLQVGGMQLLELGGDGAPHLGPWDFLAEHVRRRDASAGASDTSNRRLGFDIAAPIGALPGARIYYQVMFEDLRRQVADAIRYDADHLFGVEVAGTVPAVVVEVVKTGTRSQEHTPRVTGFTNAGRVGGAPLGPDALSAFAAVRFSVRGVALEPWLEIARLASDVYAYPAGAGIEHVARGAAERRQRVGLRAAAGVARGVDVGVEATYERVQAFSFDPAAERDSLGVTATISWQPAKNCERRPCRLTSVDATRLRSW